MCSVSACVRACVNLQVRAVQCTVRVLLPYANCAAYYADRDGRACNVDVIAVAGRDVVSACAQHAHPTTGARRPPLCCCSLCLTRVARLSILTAPAQRLSREAARLVVRLTPVCRPPPDQPVRLSSALPTGSPIRAGGRRS